MKAAGHTDQVRLYLSSEHACGYLPARGARNAYLDPEYALDPTRYGQLLGQGFRRSGVHVYRPHCAGCQSCLAARIPVREFTPSRSQRRCQRRNADLSLSITHDLNDEHFELYGRYLAARHAGGGMEGGNQDAFHAFLECVWNDTEFWELRNPAGQLMAVAVTDAVPRALSAVYTFFDPQETARGLGNFAVLTQVQIARERGLDHVYLGYWVPGSAKMDYKQGFQPLELLTPQGWNRVC